MWKCSSTTKPQSTLNPEKDQLANPRPYDYIFDTQIEAQTHDPEFKNLVLSSNSDYSKICSDFDDVFHRKDGMMYLATVTGSSIK